MAGVLCPHCHQDLLGFDSEGQGETVGGGSPASPLSEQPQPEEAPGDVSDSSGTAQTTPALLGERQPQTGALPGALPREKQSLSFSGVMPLMQEITLFHPEGEVGSKSLGSCAPDICLCALATACRGCQAAAEAL